ncbi:MAG: hypothetical protein HRT66_06895 [Flavobacteriaceae bacterium]|nr:hypothetical protein [Flavobacteriaceae bacterium]
MKKKLLLLGLLLLFNFIGFSQIGIGTDNPNTDSMLDIFSSTKGVVLPRVYLKSIEDSFPMNTHVMGMIVYNTSDIGGLYKGYYYNDGEKWIRFIGSDTNIETKGKVILYGIYDDLNGDVGKVGDFFLDLTNYDLYGPKGDNGWTTNKKSLIGTRGNSILNGTVSPNSDQGNIGDFYINTSGNELWGLRLRRDGRHL